MSDTIDDLQWLTDLDGGDVPPSAASLQLAGDQLAAAIAAPSTTTTSAPAVDRRRWRAAGLVGVAATGIVVTLSPARVYPGAWARSPSAQTQLEDRRPSRGDSFSSTTRSRPKPARRQPTTRRVRSVYVACLHHDHVVAHRRRRTVRGPTTPMRPRRCCTKWNSNVTDIAVARTPEEIARIADEFVVDRSTEADWSGEPSDPTELRTAAIGLTP